MNSHINLGQYSNPVTSWNFLWSGKGMKRGLSADPSSSSSSGAVAKKAEARWAWVRHFVRIATFPKRQIGILTRQYQYNKYRIMWQPWDQVKIVTLTGICHYATCTVLSRNQIKIGNVVTLSAICHKVVVTISDTLNIFNKGQCYFWPRLCPLFFAKYRIGMSLICPLFLDKFCSRMP